MGREKKHLQKLEDCETAKASELMLSLYNHHQAGGMFWAEGKYWYQQSEISYWGIWFYYFFLCRA